MSIWLERFVLTVLAAVLGATVLTNPWHLDRLQQTTLIVAVIAMSLFTARTIERARGGGQSGVQLEGPDNPASSGVSFESASTRPQVDAAQPNELLAPALDAEAAAEHHRRTSPRLKREEIRGAYKEYCDRIAARFGLAAWAPVNQLTRMVATNMGDMEAFARAEAEVPKAAWVAIRVLVAFETANERPMYMSYVFVGRAPSGEEMVALFDVSKQWAVLSLSRDPNMDHEQLIIDTIQTQLQHLSERIAPDIRRLG